MGRINFEDQALIKRWQACKKLNVMSRKLKDDKKKSNCRRLFSFIARSCEHFQNYGVHKNMSAKSVIERLQKITKEKEA